jgi:membrane-anchored mycosin MYCP
VTSLDRAAAALPRAVGMLPPEVLLVAAAGNYGTFKDGNVTSNYTGPTETTPQWPAALPDVIIVGASDPGADFSPDVPWIDLLAPGVGGIRVR